MEYIEIIDNKIIGHYCSKEKPVGDQYKAVTNFQGHVGIDAGMITESGELKTIEELISEGFVKDNRGVYYNTETKQEIEIKNVGVEIPDQFTKLKPKEFDNWDGSKWVTDVELELETIKERAYHTVKSEKEIKLKNGFQFMGKIIQADEKSETAFSKYFVKKDSIPYPVRWRCADNSYLFLSDATIIEDLSNAFLQFTGYLIEYTFDVLDSINNATSVSGIEEIIRSYKEFIL